MCSISPWHSLALPPYRRVPRSFPWSSRGHLGNVASRCPDQDSCRPLGRDQTLVPYRLRSGAHQVDATCGAESKCRSHAGTTAALSGRHRTIRCSEETRIRKAVLGPSAQAEWWVAIRDQQECVRRNAERPPKYSDHEVKQWARVVAGQENCDPSSDQDWNGQDPKHGQ